MPEEDSLRHGKVTDSCIVTPSDWNTLYEYMRNIIDELNVMKGERLFDNKGKLPNEWSKNHLYYYCMSYFSNLI